MNRFRAVALAALSGVVLTACGAQSAPVRTVTVTATPSTSSSPEVTKLYEAGQYSVFDGVIRLGSARLATPQGTWQFGLGSVDSSVASDTGAHYLTLGSNVLVPVVWSFTAPDGTVTDASAPAPKPPAGTVVRLVAGGKEYVLADDVTASDTSVVAVSGAATQPLAVTVSYGGLTQRVDLRTGKTSGTSRAAGLYDGLSSTGSATCPPITNGYVSGPGLQVSATCGLVSISRAAYLPGRGWAAPGRVWVSATVIVNPDELIWHNPNGSVSTYTTKVEVTGASLDGAAAAAGVQRNGNAFTMVFSAPAGKASTSLLVTQKLSGSTDRVAPAQVPLAPAAPSTTSAAPSATSTASASATSSKASTPPPASSTTTPSVNAPATVSITQNITSTVTFRKAD